MSEIACPRRHTSKAFIGPAPLRGPRDSSGNIAGCKSACLANLDGNQGAPAIASRPLITLLPTEHMLFFFIRKFPELLLWYPRYSPNLSCFRCVTFAEIQLLWWPDRDTQAFNITATSRTVVAMRMLTHTTNQAGRRFGHAMRV